MLLPTTFFCTVQQQSDGRAWSSRPSHNTLLTAAEYSFEEDLHFHPPLLPLRVRLPVGKLTIHNFRTLLHSLETGSIRQRDDSGKLPIHIACQTNAPVEVLAVLIEIDPATLHIADHCSGNLP